MQLSEKSFREAHEATGNVGKVPDFEAVVAPGQSRPGLVDPVTGAEMAEVECWHNVERWGQRRREVYVVTVPGVVEVPEGPVKFKGLRLEVWATRKNPGVLGVRWSADGIEDAGARSKSGAAA